MDALAKRLNRRSFVKGIAATAAVAAMTPLLAACGGDDDDDDGDSPAATTSGSSGSSATTGSGSTASATSGSSGSGSGGERVKVVYWGSFSDALGEAEQEVVARFNDSQQDVEVEYQFQGTYEETAQKLTQALAANQAPDVSLLSDVWWFKFYVNQKLAPLNDFISAAGIDTSDYVDSLYIEGVREDTSFWLPFARSTPLFYFNRDAFAEAGLPDRGPETWDEFMEWAPQLVTKDGSTITRSAFAHPGAASYIAWLFQGAIWQFNGRYSDPDFTIRIAEPEGIAAGEFYKASVGDGWATAPVDINADFTNQLTCAMMASTGGLKSIQETATFEVGTSFLPEKETFGCPTGGAGLAILSTSPREKQEAAFKFIEFATSPETTTYWSQNTGYMPVRKSAFNSPEMTEFFTTNPNFKTAVDQLARTQPQDAARVFIPGGDQIIGKGLERITINQEDVASAFADVQAELEAEAQPVLDAMKNL